jgi:protein-tyrosine phosphatase
MRIKMRYKEEDMDFVWIVKDQMAASCIPNEKMYEFFWDLGIKVVVNLTMQDIRAQKIDGLIYEHIPVEDFSIPSIAQIQSFLQLTEEYKKKKMPIVVHCFGGCGRTGQFITIWAYKQGLIPHDADPVTWGRQFRPCFIESADQRKFIMEWIQNN